MGKIYNFIFNQGILFPFNKYKLIKILCFAKRQYLFFLQISWKPHGHLLMWLQCPLSSHVHRSHPHTLSLSVERALLWQMGLQILFRCNTSFPPLPNTRPCTKFQIFKGALLRRESGFQWSPIQSPLSQYLSTQEMMCEVAVKQTPQLPTGHIMKGEEGTK